MIFVPVVQTDNFCKFQRLLDHYLLKFVRKLAFNHYLLLKDRETNNNDILVTYRISTKLKNIFKFSEVQGMI